MKRIVPRDLNEVLVKLLAFGFGFTNFNSCFLEDFDNCKWGRMALALSSIWIIIIGTII